MAIRKIIYLPDPRLRANNAPVTVFDDTLDVLINDMFDTMYHARGVGLAAPQIGVNLQLSVIDIEGDGAHPIVLINPQIIHQEGRAEFSEGCLSIPGGYEKVIRAERVTVHAQDRTGLPFEITAEGLLSECLQHEIDHLHGILFIDQLSPFKQSLVRKKMKKHLQEKKSAS